jgi:hypothetical protein
MENDYRQKSWLWTFEMWIFSKVHGGKNHKTAADSYRHENLRSSIIFVVLRVAREHVRLHRAVEDLPMCFLPSPVNQSCVLNRSTNHRIVCQYPLVVHVLEPKNITNDGRSCELQPIKGAFERRHLPLFLHLFILLLSTYGKKWGRRGGAISPSRMT